MNMIQMFFIVTLVITVITCPVYEPLVWAQIWFYCTILLPPNTFSTWTVFVCYSCDFQVTGFYIICRIICETKSSTTYRVYCRQSMHVSLRCQILQPGQRPHASSASLVECHSCAVAWRARKSESGASFVGPFPLETAVSSCQEWRVFHSRNWYHKCSMSDVT